MKRISLLSLVLVSVISSPASAHKLGRWDPDDVRSRLDMRRFTYAHADDEESIRGKIMSFDDWGPRVLNRQKLMIWCDFLGSEDYRGEGEYEIKFRYRTGKGDYVGNVWYTSETQPAYEWVGRAKVWRPDQKTLRWEADSNLFTADSIARVGSWGGGAYLSPRTRRDDTRGLDH